MTPHSELNSHLKDSIAAKAANKALLKWHLNAPTANLHDLEEMYNRLYEYFYEFYDHHSNTHHYHHYDGLDHSFVGYHPDYENHHHHHHHIYHNHKHFNILDFLGKKLENEKSKKKLFFLPVF
jgi:hypothetical protein